MPGPEVVVARIRHVATMESLAVRLMPGEALPEWASEPSPAGEVPGEVTLRDWIPGHLMASLRASLSRQANGSTAPAVAVAVTVGVLYEIERSDTLDSPSASSGMLSSLPEEILERLATRARDDGAPFLRQAVHAASGTVDPLNPIILSGLTPAQSEPIALGEVLIEAPSGR